MSAKGRFIVVEGIDGSGSTTQVKRLCDWLSARGHDTAMTAEPSTGPVGVLIRQILQHRVVVPSETGARAPHWSTMALLFAADRLDHIDALIEPELAAGKVVVSDRYTLSSLAYQSLTADAKADPLDWLRAINEQARAPDLTIVLDVDAEVAAERRAARRSNRELFEVESLQRRLASAYLNAETLLPAGHRVVHVDGNAPQDMVFQAIQKATATVIDER